MANLPARTGQHVTVRFVDEPSDLAEQARTEFTENDYWLPLTAKQLILKGINPQTRKAYGQAFRPFAAVCAAADRKFAPATEETLVWYIDNWRTRPIHVKCKCRLHRPSPSTLWIWYSAVRFWHRMHSPPLPWAAGEQLTAAMVGYSVEMVEQGWSPQKAPRAYDQDITRMIDALDLSRPKHLRDRAVLTTNFYTASRSADLATYRLADVSHNPKGIELALRNSKTNKRVGKLVEYRTVFANDDHPQYCGVEALHSWTDWLLTQGISQGALFRPFDKHGNLRRGASDLMDYKMSGTTLSEVVRDAAMLAALPHASDYTCHSLRRGRATQQRELGVDPLDIARAYGWVPGGAINVYLEEANRWAPTAPGSVGMLGS